VITILKYFFVAFVLSAIGSMPIGLITLTVAQKTIEKGKRAGWQLAVGATIMEFVYTAIALYGLDYLSIETSWKGYIQLISIVLFFILGIYFWTKKNSPIDLSVKRTESIAFLQGILVGAMNLFIVPFWIVLAIWLESYDMLFDESTAILSFSLGSALGALLIFIGYVEGSVLVMKKSDKITAYANKVIGGLFLVLSVIQFINYFDLLNLPFPI